MSEIPKSHPRYNSLISRERMVEASKDGLLAESAMIAHGRGEAFDYLLGEKTSTSALKSIKEVARRLKNAKNPVISVNGNTAILAGENLIKIAATISCPIEINIYYRTPLRISKLLDLMHEYKQKISSERPPEKWKGKDWEKRIKSVKILGENCKGKITGLEGPRSICCLDGIVKADVVLVPLEDGDRCEALIALGKEVLVIDLNPLSRTARNATVTIVDEVSRASKILLEEISNDECEEGLWDNNTVLVDALKIISNSVNRIK
jgi:4-phosphopantoate--beta-alanine ligase